ncbi:NHLP bacteriocin export ABC transporter permease/ATPase subunit [Legionella taurinensis]|uniref:NHLP bacteriocin export ABC transporter permease/ATPase subunit n=1 Tax=Legionella taurinensis TaxID=70611 RepID=A0A3A5L8V7_9GAMM|nr:NHLP bacteriocin export ABC transporter permease/ATPase subunit [Legionella taurinensis]RJT46988.1 NHLP bacteriocin export ABC transporter permease/ATPase subunit [Legionella taurinensis]RJT66810.1 NHLP bacteriocin export ABC transporter permease/ATPase subunit [Legionella taurinensis]
MMTDHAPPNELDLLQSDRHYRVLKGHVHLFLVPGEGPYRRYLIGHCQPGDVLLGLKGHAPEAGWQLLASCGTEAELQAVTDAWLNKEEQRASLKSWQQHFVNYLKNTPFDGQVSQLNDNHTGTSQQAAAGKAFVKSILPDLVQASDWLRQQEEERARERKKIENNRLKRAYLSMISTLGSKQPVAQTGRQDTLTYCVQRTAAFYQLALPEHVHVDAIQEINLKTGMAIRPVQLNGTWWRGATHPLLLQKPEDNAYYLALPTLTRGLLLIDPVQGISKKLTPKEAAFFAGEAWQMYCPLPQKPLKIRDLIPFAFRGGQRDLIRLLSVGSLAALLSLVTPWFTGILFEQVVPAGDINQLQQIILALLIAAFSAGLFELVRTITVLRLSSRLNLNLEVAIWDRLIRLPVTFFKQFTTGDLTQRAMAISHIRTLLAGVVVNSLLSGIFSLFSLILLFYYDLSLAVTATLIILAICAYTLIISLRQLKHYKEQETLQGDLSGMVVQLLGGIGKIQSSGREKTAFSQWAIKNSQIKQAAYRTNQAGALLASLNSFFLTLLSVVVFTQFLHRTDTLSLGLFLAFNATLGQFTAGMLGLTDIAGTLINSIPLLKRAAPILEALPETHAGKRDPGVLKGKIEVDHLRFSYAKEQPVIKNVSFTIHPGQYVAITGPSGSGKSTLLRLLLGFETPDQGNLFFDDHDIKQLNVQRVREQCGVVLQNSTLLSGTLFENIAGSALLSLDEAWDAADMAGLAADIEKMPMGMHTVISERGGTLSGGQRQRVLIARALAKKPRLLFFDEATSALDNVTQAIVIQSLATLNITRVVIAHRLTTIEKADFILVMDQGEVVQCGSYSQLMDEDGLFRQMATRQLIN